MTFRRLPLFKNIEKLSLFFFNEKSQETILRKIKVINFLCSQVRGNFGKSVNIKKNQIKAIENINLDKVFEMPI